MNKLNELTTYAWARTDAFFTALKDEEGADAIQTAGGALAAAAIVGGLLAGAGRVREAVQSAMERAAAALSGG